jgi:drug/metabolite transporter (DMT)-like permease
VGLAALILVAVVRIAGLAVPSGRDAWAAFFAMGFLNNVVPFTLIVWGQSHIPSGLASILNATTPLFGVILAHWCTADEKMTGGRLLGVIVGLAGVAIMIGGDALRHFGVDVLAQLAVLAAALSYACAGVFGRRFRAMGVAPMAAATGQLVASSLMLVPVMLLVDEPWTLPMPSLPTVGSLVGIAALSTALAYVLYFRILATAGATNILLVTLLLPVSALLLGVLVLDEGLRAEHLVGMALIGIGLAAIDGRPWFAIRRRSTTERRG